MIDLPGSLRALLRTFTGRMVAVALLATVVFGLCFGAVSKTVVTTLLRREQMERGVALGEGLAAAAGEALAVGDLVGLHALLRSAAESQPRVHHIAVFDAQSRLVAHTLSRDPSSAFAAALLDRAGGDPLALATEHGIVHDVVVPLRPAAAGELHVGVPEAWIAETITNLSTLFASAGAAALFGGLFFAWRAGRWFVEPLDAMARAATRISRDMDTGRGTPPRPIALPVLPAPGASSMSEVAELTEAFNSMAHSLYRSRSDLAEAQRHLVRTERMAALGAFVAGTAHAVNNPLGGIRACLEMIASTHRDAGKLLRYTTLAHEGLARIDGLVRRLLQFVREGGGAPVLFDLNALVARSLVVDHIATKARELNLTLDLCSDDLPVLADPFEVEQALTNVIVNAIQASPTGGVVRVRTARDERSVGMARIDVEDRGPGLDDHVKDRIFEPFFSTKPEQEGTGLGLWVVWGVMERCRGSVLADNRPEGGARFSLLFPMATGPQADGNGGRDA